MITALLFVRRHWKVAAMLATLLLLYVTIHGWMERECARRELRMRQTYERLLEAERERVRVTERKWQTLVYEVERANQDRLQALEEKYRGAAERIGPVRVCEPTRGRDPRVSRTAPAPAVDHDPTRDHRLSGGAGGRDIGPGLRRITKAADTQTARLIACQHYVNTLLQGPNTR